MFGIVRTMAMSPPAQRFMSASRTPAAIDTRSGPCAPSTGASASTTGRMICGLTASTTVAQCDTTAPLSLSVWTPNRSLRSSSFGVSGSETRIVRGGVPFATSPPMRLAAMLPPPMNPMFESLIRATLRSSRLVPGIIGHRVIAATRAGDRPPATGHGLDVNV